MTTSRKRRENPFAIQSIEGLIDEEQMKVDLIEGYMRVKCRISVHSFRMSLKFSTSTVTNFE